MPYESNSNKIPIVGLQDAKRAEITQLVQKDPSLRSKSYREDIIQDTFVRCLDRQEQDPSRENDKSETKKSLNNVAKTNRRRESKRLSREVPFPEGGSDQLPQSSVEFPSGWIILCVEISKLPPRLNAIILLHIKGYTCQEIAKKLSIHRTTAQSDLGIARKSLWASLTDTDV